MAINLQRPKDSSKMDGNAGRGSISGKKKRGIRKQGFEAVSPWRIRKGKRKVMKSRSIKKRKTMRRKQAQREINKSDRKIRRLQKWKK